jgi:hypothetical protein
MPNGPPFYIANNTSRKPHERSNSTSRVKHCEALETRAGPNLPYRQLTCVPSQRLHGELRVPMGWEGSAEKTLTSLYGSTASEMTLGG